MSECMVCTYLREQELIHEARRDKEEGVLENTPYNTTEWTKHNFRVKLHTERLYAVWALQVEHVRKFHPYDPTSEDVAHHLG